MSDPYAILGVAKNASDAEIKSAYRKLAKKHHPDVNKGNAASEKKFSQASTAYDILSDKTKRSQYDRGEIDGEGKQKFAGFGGGAGGGNPFGGGARAGGGFSGINPDDILNEIFGGSRGARGGAGMGGRTGTAGRGYSDPFQRAEPQAPAKTEISADVPVNVALDGGRVAIELPSGKAVRISVPKGVTQGQQIRVIDNDKPIYITVNIVSGGGYRVEGSKLYYDLPITLYEAVLGATVTLETPTGQLSIKIQEGTTGDKTLRLREKGLLISKDKRGDMFVVPKIILPDNASKDLKTLMEFWQQNNPYEPRLRT